MIFKGSKKDVAKLVYDSITFGVKGALTPELLVKGYTRNELEQMLLELLNGKAYDRKELKFTPLLKKNKTA